jgi:hypothetical protein
MSEKLIDILPFSGQEINSTPNLAKGNLLGGAAVQAETVTDTQPTQNINSQNANMPTPSSPNNPETESNSSTSPPAA